MKPTHFLVTVERLEGGEHGKKVHAWCPAWCRSIAYAKPGTTKTHLYRKRFWAEEARLDIQSVHGTQVKVTITPMALVPVGDPE